MQIIVYDNRFNANEWFVCILFIAGFAAVLLFPKRYSLKESLLYLLFGMFWAKFFDHTISIKPFDFYDVNDASSYQIMDFVSYLMFAPFAYLFVYLHDILRVKRRLLPIYVAAWSSISVGMEYFACKIGVYHYKNGYNLLYSLPLYFFTQSTLLWLVHRVRAAAPHPAGASAKKS